MVHWTSYHVGLPAPLYLECPCTHPNIFSPQRTQASSSNQFQRPLKPHFEPGLVMSFIAAPRLGHFCCYCPSRSLSGYSGTGLARTPLSHLPPLFQCLPSQLPTLLSLDTNDISRPQRYMVVLIVKGQTILRLCILVRFLRIVPRLSLFSRISVAAFQSPRLPMEPSNPYQPLGRVTDLTIIPFFPSSLSSTYVQNCTFFLAAVARVFAMDVPPTFV